MYSVYDALLCVIAGITVCYGGYYCMLCVVLYLDIVSKRTCLLRCLIEISYIEISRWII